MRPLPEPADEPLPGDPRPAERRLPARRDHAPVARRRADPSLHGHLDLRRVHRDAGDRARQGRREAPLDGACLFACGLSTGIGAALYTAEVEPGATWSSSARARRPRRRHRRRLQRGRADHRVDLSEDRLELARGQGATDTLASPEPPSSGSAARPAASAPTTPSRRPAASPSCARRSRRRGWAGASRRSPASPARARRSRSCRAS